MKVRSPLGASPFAAMRAMGIFFLLFLCVLFGGGLWFLYTHMYQTIGSVEHIIELQATGGVEVIQFNRFDKVQAEWERKHMTTSTIARDPFFVAPVAPAPTTTVEISAQE